MKRNTIIWIIIGILLLALLSWGGYFGYQQYDAYETQISEFTDYKADVEDASMTRYNKKLKDLKGQYTEIDSSLAKILNQLADNRFYTSDKEDLMRRFQNIYEELQRNAGVIDTLYYGSNISETGLDNFQRAVVTYLQEMNEALEEDARIAKKRIASYRYRLKAYRDSMLLYLDQKKMLLDSLQTLQSLAENGKTDKSLEEERDRLLAMLEAKDSTLDMMTSDTTDYAKIIRGLEDSLALVTNREQPLQVMELHCYYVPKEREKRGKVWLNDQPIHTPNKVREITIEFQTNIPEFSDENKAELVLYFNKVPIRSQDLIITNGYCNTVFDCKDEKLEPGAYSLQIKYAGETIREHTFRISKPTLF
ncbi:MAG: hypothetical protein ACPGJS_16605 [Flammeovirgaceae bacterium]